MPSVARPNWLDLFPEYYEQRVASKIPVKAIVPAPPFNVQEAHQSDPKHLRNTHLIPEEYDYPIEVNIYKQTTVFYSFEEHFALVIKSKPIASCLKLIFEFAFEYTEGIDKKIRSHKGSL